MSNSSEIKILRDELARVLADVQKKDRVIEETQTQLRQLHIEIERNRIEIERNRIEIERLGVENNRLRAEASAGAGRMAYYENPHSPPSQNSMPSRQRKADRRKDPADCKKPGRKAGHAGISHSRKSSRTVHYVPDRCGRCGSRDVAAGRIACMKQVTDIPSLPRAETVSHAAHDGMCASCGNTTSAPSLYGDGLGKAVRGTSVGPVLLSEMTQMWHHNMSTGGITEMINDSFGTGLSRAAVQGALAAAGAALQGAADGISADLGDSRYLKADETPYPMAGSSSGHMWVVVGDRSVLIHAAPSRSGLVMLDIAPYCDKPLTCDGYSGYSEFGTKQRCWAHILREAEDLARIHGGRVPGLEALRGELAGLYHRAKLRRRGHGDPVPVDTGPMEAAASAIASRYGQYAEGGTFAVKLGNAVPYLFTFVNCPGMDPTNNESERMLRKAVIARKIRYRIASDRGARMFSNIMTAVLTWKKRGLCVSDMLLKALRGT